MVDGVVAPAMAAVAMVGRVKAGVATAAAWLAAAATVGRAMAVVAIRVAERWVAAARARVA